MPPAAGIVITQLTHARMRRVGAAVAALAARWALQHGDGHGGDPVSFDHDIAKRRERSGGTVGLEPQGTDALPQDRAPFLDRRQFVGIDVQRGLRHRRDRNSLDLHVAGIARRLAGGNHRPGDNGADRQS